MNAIAEISKPDRTTFVGGSDVAAILGMSPWRNIVDLWMDKVLPAEEKGLNAAAKRRGSRLEPYILDMIREKHGLQIVAAHERYTDQQQPFLACEIEAAYSDSTGQRQNIEIKTVHPFKAKEWGDIETEQLPLHYVAQVQHVLGITDRDVCRVFALIGDDLKPYVIERDDELINLMREKAISFWNDLVLPKIQPPMDCEHKDILETLKRLYPGTDCTIIEASDMYQHWRAVYDHPKEMRDKYEGILDGARTHLLAEMGSAAAIRFDDGKAFCRKVINKKGCTVAYQPSKYVDFRLANLKEGNISMSTAALKRAPLAKSLRSPKT